MGNQQLHLIHAIMLTQIPPIMATQDTILTNLLFLDNMYDVPTI